MPNQKSQWKFLARREHRKPKSERDQTKQPQSMHFFYFPSKQVLANVCRLAVTKWMLLGLHSSTYLRTHGCALHKVFGKNQWSFIQKIGLKLSLDQLYIPLFIHLYRIALYIAGFLPDQISSGFAVV